MLAGQRCAGEECLMMILEPVQGMVACSLTVRADPPLVPEVVRTRPAIGTAGQDDVVRGGDRLTHARDPRPGVSQAGRSLETDENGASDERPPKTWDVTSRGLVGCLQGYLSAGCAWKKLAPGTLGVTRLKLKQRRAREGRRGTGGKPKRKRTRHQNRRARAQQRPCPIYILDLAHFPPSLEKRKAKKEEIEEDGSSISRILADVERATAFGCPTMGASAAACRV